MALKAGRVGVRTDQVDPYGRVNTGEQYVLPTASSDTLGGVKVGTGVSIDSSGVLSADSQVPAYSSAEAGKLLSVDSDGELEFIEPPSSGGMKLYTKEFSIAGSDYITPNSPATGMGTYLVGNVGISGYTPVFVTCVDVYSGYRYVAGLTASGANVSAIAFGNRGDRTSTGDVRFKVYYVKNDECSITVLN